MPRYRCRAYQMRPFQADSLKHAASLVAQYIGGTLGTKTWAWMDSRHVPDMNMTTFEVSYYTVPRQRRLISIIELE